MRIAHRNIITEIGFIALTVALLGCSPGARLVGPKLNLNRLAPSPLNQVEQTTEPATSSDLFGIAPNPFNPATELSFTAPDGVGMVTLAIHGVDGRRARWLVAAELPGGRHAVIWRGRDDKGRKLPSGVYFASLHSGGEIRVRKLVLVQ